MAAAYFPTTAKEFKDVKTKFEGDLGGVQKNNASGIVFITNQKLTPSERTELETIAQGKKHTCILYHVERVLGILNSPAGYGVRLQYLGIAMSTEEQLSFFSRWDSQLSDKLHENSLLIIRSLSQKIDSLAGPMAAIHGEIGNFSDFASRTTSAIENIIAQSDKSKIPAPFQTHATGSLSVDIICTLHRALMLDASRGTALPTGILRNREVWIGNGSSLKEDATFVPPSPETINEKLEELCSWWNGEYQKLLHGEKVNKIKALAKFHHDFLYIHPFVDGNGRLARFILTQQALELLGITRKIVIEDRRPYLEALKNANMGDYSALEKEITQSLFGIEFIIGSPCQMSGQICPSCGNGVLDIIPDQSGVNCVKCGAEYYPA